MSSRRLLIVIGALAAGLIAAALIFQYMSSLQNEAADENQKVTVAIAQAKIAKGGDATKAIAENAISTAQRPRLDIPEGAVVRPEELKSLVAAVDIQAGTVLTPSMFVQPNELRDTNSTVLGEGMVAMSLSIDPVKSVSGLIKPGDFVNIMARGSCISGAGGALNLVIGVNKDPAAVSCTGMLFQKAKVLGVGKSLGSVVGAPADANGATTTTAPQGSDLVTFEVPVEVAQRLASVNPGETYLQLVRSDYAPKTVTPDKAFVPLEGASGVTPYPTTTGATGT